MSYTIVFDPKFTAHLERHRRAGSIGLLRKIDTLLEELEQHPRTFSFAT